MARQEEGIADRNRQSAQRRPVDRFEVVTVGIMIASAVAFWLVR